jgi:ribose transport system permease protein
MNVLSVQSYWQSLVIGVIILVGVSFDTLRRSRAGRPVFARRPAADTPSLPPSTTPSKS